MAHHKSAKKRIRRNERRRVVNRARRGRIRTSLKSVEAAIGAGDRAAAEAAFRDAQPQLMRGVSRGVVARNAMRRKLSRLSARIKALWAPMPPPPRRRVRRTGHEPGRRRPAGRRTGWKCDGHVAIPRGPR